MNKDTLFKDPGRRRPFAFDSEVVAVFDDMLQRSVPFYLEIQNMIADLADYYAQDETCIYDLGCSTGATLRLLSKRVEKKVRFVGIDGSEPMVDECRRRCKNIDIQLHDLNVPPAIENASVVVLNLTLQFLKNREALLNAIYQGLRPGGCVIVVEKISGDPLFSELYHHFKARQGYSEEEIKNKDAALNGVLVPLTLQENIDQLGWAGFGQVETFFQWFNFAGIVALKRHG